MNPGPGPTRRRLGWLIAPLLIAALALVLWGAVWALTGWLIWTSGDVN